MKRQRSHEERKALEIIEEAFHLVRRGPVSALAAYYLGSLPLVLGLLFFWSDMAHSAFASERLTFGSLGLTILFLWMKTWQGVAAQLWLAEVSGEPAPAKRARWIMRTALHQAILQPFGLFLLPACLALMVPFGWAFAFFNNVTVFSGSPTANLRSLVARSWRQAALWPVQNHSALFLFQFFGLFVLLNLLTGVLAVPFLMKTFFGIESVFTQSPWAALNSTLFAALAGLSWLCLDPVIKATYVLRCFYGESLQTGADLKAELKRLATPNRLAAAALLVVALSLFPGSAALAQDGETIRDGATATPRSGSAGAVSPSALDRSIDQVIQKREYSWRLPREKRAAATDAATSNWLDRFFKSVEDGVKAAGRWISDAVDWIFKQLRPKKTPNLGTFNLADSLRGLFFVLIVVLAFLLLWLLFRVWHGRETVNETIARPAAPVPDLADENTGAEQLPEDGWVDLARELLGRGELRLAMRAFYLATLAYLAGQNLITLAKFKSNRDYERELLRRGHALAELPELFSRNVSAFERVWYGLHEVTAEMVTDFARNVERMKRPA